MRDSATSLWLQEGRTIIEVATWMGYSGQMALSSAPRRRSGARGRRAYRSASETTTSHSVDLTGKGGIGGFPTPPEG